MRKPSSFRARCARLAAITLVAAGNAVTATAQLTTTVDGGGGLYLSTVMGRTTIREPSGDVSPLVLPHGGVVRCLVHLEDGWLAAGSIDVPGGSDLHLVSSRAGARQHLPVPPNPTGDLLRGWPVPLVEGGRLVGLAWLGGRRTETSTVWVSSWSGVDWTPPRLVGPRGPGSQIALTGTVLADGSWLLAWTAYDGEDTEILWSRRAAGRWSTPAPLHEPNRVPDELPALIATGRGALAAWSGFDGHDYRVRLARFENGAWRPLEISGPAGSAHASFQATSGGALLVYRTVSPFGWTVLELDERGAELRRAKAPAASTWRPALRPVGEEFQLEWLEPKAASRSRVQAVEWESEP